MTLRKKILSAAFLLTVTTLLPAQLKVEPTFNSCSIYFAAAQPGDCQISYRRANGGDWRPALPPVYDTANKEYRGSIVRLDENTPYEVKVEVRGESGAPTSATARTTTWTSTPRIGATRKLSSFAAAGSRAIEVVGLKGKLDAWVKITSDADFDAQADRDYAIKVDDCQYVIFEGITVKGGYLHGFLVTPSSADVRIVNCDISQWGRIPKTQVRRGEFQDKDGKLINNDAGVCIDRAKNIVVERCYIHDPNGYSNAWRGKIQMGDLSGQNFSNTHPQGPNGVFVRDSVGGTVLRYNDITGSHTHRYNDPVETSENGDVEGGFNRDADIYGNVLAFGQDDSIELDGGQCNVRMFDNRLEQTLCGISTAPNKKGPSYMFNNLVWNLGDSGGVAGAAVKNGGGIVHSIGRQYFFNNTIISSGYGCMQGVGFGDGGPVNKRDLFHAYTRNNIFMMVAPSDAPAGKGNSGPSISDKYNLETNSFDYDMVANDTRPEGKGVMIAADTNEKHGVFASPVFTDAAHGVFTPAASDPGVDRGVVVANFTGAFQGKAPDMGALEAGGSTLVPIRPIAVSADKYFVKLGAGRPETITVKIGRIGAGQAYAVRQSADMGWLAIKPGTGKAAENSTFTIELEASRVEPGQKGMIFVRLANGFSIPVTVFAE